MELIPNNEVFQEDKRNTKKMMLPTDAVCTKCGIIFNSVYEDQCLICEPCEKDVDIDNKKENKEDINITSLQILDEHKEYKKGKEKDKEGNEVCDHKDFIMGRQSVDLRILLDFHVEDLRALCEIHGCSEGGSRGKMVINIMKQLYSNLDRRINERLVRKMIVRNRKKFRFWRDIEDAINRAKKPGKIRIVEAEDCLDITEIPKKKN